MTESVIGPISGDKNAVLAYASAGGSLRMDQVTLFVNELWRLGVLCGIDPFMVACQSALETGDPITGHGWRSKHWNERLNPGGLGVTSQDMQDAWDQGISFSNGTDAARAMLVHHAAYLGIMPEVLKLYIPLDPRYSAAKNAYAGTVKYWSDYGGGKWAEDPNYYEKILSRRTSIRRFQSVDWKPPAPTPSPTTPVGGTMYSLEQLKKEVPYTTWLIPTWMTNQRPGIWQKALYINIHETANTRVGMGARAHAIWMHNGAPGGADAQVGVHYFVDDKEIFQVLPWDEVSWNAGCGRCNGNYAAISIELCVNVDGDFEKARTNVAKLVAALMNELNIDIAHVVNHQFWSGKWCPAFILQRGLWANQINQVNAFLKSEIPNPYATPRPVMVNGKLWDGLRDVYINTAHFRAEKRSVKAGPYGCNFRLWAADEARLTRSPMEAGRGFSVLGWVGGESIDGESRWWITPAGSRVWCGATEEKPTLGINNENPDWIHIPGLADIPRILDGERLYPVNPDARGKLITVTRDANLRESPKRDSKIIGKVRAGQTIRVMFWQIGDEVAGDNLWWVINPPLAETPDWDGGRLWVAATSERPI